MAITSGLFNSVNGDRKYNAVWFARYFALFIGNGVFPNPSTGLQVIQNENMTVTVKPGDGWINGYFIVNDSNYVLTHANADGVLKRIDRIVLQLDFSARVIGIVVKKGAFASTPIAPVLQRDADFYELALADVLINPGATQINQSIITDLRLNNELCGIVHNAVDQVDTTTIFNQYQSWYEQMTGVKLAEYDAWFGQHQAEFNSWFAGIRDILDANVAGNLLLLIQKNETNIKSLIKIKRNVTVLSTEWVLNTLTGLLEYVINDNDITIDHVVDVNIHVGSLSAATYMLSACDSGNGTLTLYSSDAVESDIITDYRITREVL